MNNQIFDTNFSELNEQSAEPLTLPEPSSPTLISPAKYNNMNTLQSKEKLPTKTLALRAHESNDEPTYRQKFYTQNNHIVTRISYVPE